MTDDRLRVGTRLVLTVRLAAERYDLSHHAMQEALRRGLPGVAPIDPPPIDRRTPLYYASDLDKAMKARPGKGANLRRTRSITPSANMNRATPAPITIKSRGGVSMGGFAD